jgi:hypothetical protein
MLYSSKILSLPSGHLQVLFYECTTILFAFEQKLCLVLHFLNYVRVRCASTYEIYSSPLRCYVLRLSSNQAVKQS